MKLASERKPEFITREALGVLRKNMKLAPKMNRFELMLLMACAHPTVSQYARHCFYEWKRFWQLTGIPANA